MIQCRHRVTGRGWALLLKDYDSLCVFDKAAELHHGITLSRDPFSISLYNDLKSLFMSMFRPKQIRSNETKNPFHEKHTYLLIPQQGFNPMPRFKVQHSKSLNLFKNDRSMWKSNRNLNNRESSFIKLNYLLLSGHILHAIGYISGIAICSSI